MPEDTTFTFDFGDAPPVAGSSRPDHVPPGTYLLRLEKGEKINSKGGRPGARANLRVDNGEYAGKRLVEQFWFPTNQGDSLFGLQRFHGFLVALGMKEQTKRATIDLAKFVGRTCVAEIDDEEVPAVLDDDGVSVKYASYVRSVVLAYHRVGSEGATSAQASANGSAAPAAPPAVADDDDDDLVPEVAAPAPAPKATKKAKAAAEEPAEPVAPDDDDPAAVDPEAVVTDDIDSLFE